MYIDTLGNGESQILSARQLERLELQTNSKTAGPKRDPVGWSMCIVIVVVRSFFSAGVYYYKPMYIPQARLYGLLNPAARESGSISGTRAATVMVLSLFLSMSPLHCSVVFFNLSRLLMRRTDGRATRGSSKRGWQWDVYMRCWLDCVMVDYLSVAL